MRHFDDSQIKASGDQTPVEPILSLDVWVNHKRKQILVTDIPGPPVDVCSYVSPEAQAAAESRGHATVSEIGYAKDDLLGPFTSWREALAAASTKAAALGYEVVQESLEDEELDDEDLYLDDEDEDDFDNDFDEDEDDDLDMRVDDES